MNTKYTAEQLDFFRANMSGRTWRETSEAYEAEYGERLTKTQVKHIRRYYGIPSDINGAPKGTVPQQGERYAIGDEKISNSGLVMVKVCESSHDDQAKGHAGTRCWRYKHQLVWEKEHGAPVPADCWLVFVNRDKRDFTPSNIVAIPKSVMSTINGMGLEWYDAESLQVCVSIARIRMSLKAKRKALKGGE